MRTKETIRQEFERALPRIQTHAEIIFRGVVCPHKREDFIAETVALAWVWWLRLSERDKKPLEFVSVIATFAAKAARSGRRVCGQEKAKDALSPRAQHLHRFSVSTLPAYSTLSVNPFAEALADNTKTPVDDQVAFRCDFPVWLSTYDERRRRIIEAMAGGERTLDLAEQFQVSAARISQMRSELFQSWQKFNDDLA